MDGPSESRQAIPNPMSQVNLTNIHPLFFSPLLTFDLAEHLSLNHVLRAEIAHLRAASPGVQRSNVRGWHSDDDLFERKEPGLQVLCGHILNAVQQATRNVSPNFDFTRFGAQAEGWINVLGPGGLNTPHDHPAWVWSGSYYVRVPESDDQRSGSIEFFDSRTNVRSLTVEGAPCFASKFSVKPREGMLLLFPSYLRHWVYPNENAEERISVAFNARFVRAGSP